MMNLTVLSLVRYHNIQRFYYAQDCTSQCNNMIVIDWFAHFSVTNLKDTNDATNHSNTNSFILS